MFTLQKGLYISDLVSSLNIEHGFGTTASLSANTLSQSVRPVQTHSTHIGYVTDPSSLIYNDTDGLITTLDGVIISIKTADCVPVIYSDNQHRVIGIAHMGWRGVYDNFTAQMIKGLMTKGAHIDTIKVAIGPSIGSCCYRIYGPRLDQFLSRWHAETEQSLVVHDNNRHVRK
jgi:YfiH family protein